MRVCSTLRSSAPGTGRISSKPLVRARSLSRASRQHVVAYNVPKAPLPSRDGGAVAEAPPAVDAKRLQLRHEIAAQLQGPHFDAWMEESRFQKDRLVIQMRRLWYYSTLLAPDALGAEGRFSKDRREGLRVRADAAFKDVQAFKQPNGGWRFSLGDSLSEQIHMYGVVFALYALSTYFHATGSAEAKKLADETFDGIYERRAADGGLDPEAYKADDYQTPFTQQEDALGHWTGRRSVNTHIHYLEAQTAYHEYVAKQSDSVSRRERSSVALKAVADLVVAMKPIDSPRLIELRDKKDASKPATGLRTDNSVDITKREKVFFLPGHNVEATFLVHDAYDVLGLQGPDASWTMEILEEAEGRMREGPLGERWLPHILHCTCSSNPYDCKDFDCFAVSTERELYWEAEINWWTQHELLNALVHADMRLGGPNGVKGDIYIDRAIAVWHTIKTRFVSPDGTMWDTVNSDANSVDYMKPIQNSDENSVPPNSKTHGPWKASYYTSRALVRSLQALSDGFKPALHPASWQDLQAEC